MADRADRAGSCTNFWQLDKPGSQVLADGRALAAQPIDPAATPRAAPAVEQQNDCGL